MCVSTAFLKSLSISQCIQCMISGMTAGTYTCQHYNLVFITLHKRIPKYHSQLRTSERDVLGTGTQLLGIKGADTFLQGQK